MQYTIFMILAPISGVVAILSVIASWQRRKVSGFNSLPLLLICVCGFLFCNILELVTPTEEQTMRWARLAYLFVAFLPVFWVQFALEYSGNQKLLSIKYFWVFWIIPCVTLLCVFYPPFLHLIWDRYTFERVGDTYMVLKVTEHGIWFWVYAVQGYLLDFLGAFLIFRAHFHHNKPFRQQSALVLIGSTLPLVTNFIYLSQIIPDLTKDFSPISYTIAGICFTVGITRYQLLDLMPVARNRLVEEMRDGVIVIDPTNRVVDINPSARRMLEASADWTVGYDVTYFFKNWEDWAGLPDFLDSAQEKIEVCSVLHGSEHWFDLRISQLTDARGKPGGKLLMIGDITLRKRAEAGLRKAHDELELRVAERTAELAALNATLEERVETRTRELSALYAISTIANQAANLDSLVTQALECTMSVIPCRFGVVYLIENMQENGFDLAGTPLRQLKWVAQQGKSTVGLPAFLPIEGLIRYIFEQDKPMLISNAEIIEGFGNRISPVTPAIYLIAPLLAEGNVLGILILANSMEEGYRSEDIHLLASVTRQIGLAVQRNYLRQQTILYEERQRLARDLHDSVTQSLYGLVTLTEAGQAQLEKGVIDVLEHTLVRIGQTARQTLKEMRLYIYELRPPALETEGLIGAIQLRLTAVEGRSNITTRLIADEALYLSPTVVNAVYHITQEALNNVLKHTLATVVTVRLQRTEDKLELEVCDNGCGFDLEKVTGQGMGLVNMRERAQKIGGTFQLTSAIGKGTRVYVGVPFS